MSVHTFAQHHTHNPIYADKEKRVLTIIATRTVATTAAIMLQRIPLRIPQITSGSGMIRFRIMPIKGT